MKKGSRTGTKTKTSRVNVLWGKEKVKKRREHRVKKEKGKVRSPLSVPIPIHLHTKKNSIYSSPIHPSVPLSLRLTPPSTPHPPKKSPLLVVLPVFLLTSHRHQSRSRSTTRTTTNRHRPHTLLQRIRRRRY